MLKKINYIAFIIITLFQNAYAQTVNEGMLYVSENTKFSTVSSFKNNINSSFYNDGRASFYANINNEGVFDFYNETGTLRLVGNLLQEIVGDEIFTTNIYFENSTQDFAFHLKSKLNIYKTADFQLGVLENREQGGEINFLENSYVLNVSNLSFVDGPVNKFGDSNFLFPIGNKDYYRPAGILDLKISNPHKVIYNLENPNLYYNTGAKDGLVNRIDNREYWEVTMDHSSEELLVLTWDNNTTPQFILDKTSVNDAIHIVRWNPVAQYWVDEGGVTNYDDKTVTTAISRSGVYTLALMKYSEVNPCEIIVYNAVTPNNDGFNDYLEINKEDNSCAQNLVVKIFNRWGVKVFETNNYGEPGQVFDGYSTGRLTVQNQSKLPSGTYFYVLEYQYKEEEVLSSHQKAGYIHLSAE